MKNTILSLFDFSGSWSKPYKQNGFEVIQIDLKKGIDLLHFDYKKIDKHCIKGILAAPPCTHFTRASQHLWNQYDIIGKTAASIQLVEKTLEIVNYFNPDFWAVENPPGRIEKLIPQLKNLRLMSFHPYFYGDAYSKYTILYGNFNNFLIRCEVKKEYAVKDKKGTKPMQQYHRPEYPNLDGASLRSITPKGFATAFFNANN